MPPRDRLPDGVLIKSCSSSSRPITSPSSSLNQVGWSARAAAGDTIFSVAGLFTVVPSAGSSPGPVEVLAKATAFGGTAAVVRISGSPVLSGWSGSGQSNGALGSRNRRRRNTTGVLRDPKSPALGDPVGVADSRDCSSSIVSGLTEGFLGGFSARSMASPTSDMRSTTPTWWGDPPLQFSGGSKPADRNILGASLDQGSATSSAFRSRSHKRPKIVSRETALAQCFKGLSWGFVAPAVKGPGGITNGYEDSFLDPP
mmetsp:Transcript_4709/g.10398  ORF Transcript_4709/g.10398 Transcript_4709/m.10398 type:complete len:257 (-) Transcript_4709:107-877(-)